MLGAMTRAVARGGEGGTWGACLEQRGDDLGMGEDGGDEEWCAHVRPPRLVRVRVGVRVRVRAAEYLTLFLKP